MQDYRGYCDFQADRTHGNPEIDFTGNLTEFCHFPRISRSF